MLIGNNYPKIEFEAFGLDLLEPNSFIGDTILFFVSVYAAYRVNKITNKTLFHRSWIAFFLLFGFSFFFGGLGHLLYNYWGIPGKTPSWYLGVIAVFFIEKAMISLSFSKSLKSILGWISKIKLILALLGVTMVLFYVDLEADYSKGMLVPTINSTIGLVGTLGVLAATYMRSYDGMPYFIASVLTLFPAAIIQGMKINVHQWFDKNDLSHVLLMIAITLYLKGIMKVTERNSNAV